MALDAVLLDVLRRHCSALGDTFTAQGSSKVLCRPSMRVVFAKVGQADQVLGEAESLSAMYRASQAAGHQETLIPTVHAFGTTQERGSRGFLVTDYKNLQSSLGKQAQRTLGRKLAEMHQSGTSDNGMYGFSRPTHCGATVSVSAAVSCSAYFLRSPFLWHARPAVSPSCLAPHVFFPFLPSFSLTSALLCLPCVRSRSATGLYEAPPCALTRTWS